MPTIEELIAQIAQQYGGGGVPGMPGGGMQGMPPDMAQGMPQGIPNIPQGGMPMSISPGGPPQGGMPGMGLPQGDMGSSLQSLVASVAQQYGGVPPGAQGGGQGMPQGAPQGGPGLNGLMGIRQAAKDGGNLPQFAPPNEGANMPQPEPQQPQGQQPQGQQPQGQQPQGQGIPPGQPLQDRGLDLNWVAGRDPKVIEAMNQPIGGGQPMSPAQKATLRFESQYGPRGGVVQGGYDPNAPGGPSAVMRGLGTPRELVDRLGAGAQGRQGQAEQDQTQPGSLSEMAKLIPSAPKPPRPATKAEAWNELRTYFPTASNVQLRAKLPSMLQTMDASRKQTFELDTQEHGLNLQHLRDLSSLQAHEKTAEVQDLRAQYLQQRIKKEGDPQGILTEELSGILQNTQEMRLGLGSMQKEYETAQQEVQTAADQYRQSLPFLSRPGTKTDPNAIAGLKGGDPEKLAAVQEAQARFKAAGDMRRSLSQVMSEMQTEFITKRRGAPQQGAPQPQAPQQPGATPQAAIGAPAMPKQGDVMAGYTFLGGDPAKQENWRKM